MIDKNFIFLYALSCGKCKIKVLKGKLNPISSVEKSMLTDDEIKNGIRLACLSFPKTDLKIKTQSEN